MKIKTFMREVWPSFSQVAKETIRSIRPRYFWGSVFSLLVYLLFACFGAYSDSGMAMVDAIFSAGADDLAVMGAVLTTIVMFSLFNYVYCLGACAHDLVRFVSAVRKAKSVDENAV